MRVPSGQARNLSSKFFVRRTKTPIPSVFATNRSGRPVGIEVGNWVAVATGVASGCWGSTGTLVGASAAATGGGVVAAGRVVGATTADFVAFVGRTVRTIVGVAEAVVGTLPTRTAPAISEARLRTRLRPPRSRDE